MPAVPRNLKGRIHETVDVRPGCRDRRPRAGGRPAQAQDKKFTIALIPGLTTDAFYITMRKGAEAAAKAVGAELVFQGAPEFNPVTQVPVLDAVIAKQAGRDPDRADRQGAADRSR